MNIPNTNYVDIDYPDESLSDLRRKANQLFSIWRAKANMFQKFGNGSQIDVQKAYQNYYLAEKQYQNVRKESGLPYLNMP